MLLLLAGERLATVDGRISEKVEIVTLTGWAPHESQQQPLKPGSARNSLAEALARRRRMTAPQSRSCSMAIGSSAGGMA